MSFVPGVPSIAAVSSAASIYPVPSLPPKAYVPILSPLCTTVCVLGLAVLSLVMVVRVLVQVVFSVSDCRRRLRLLTNDGAKSVLIRHACAQVALPVAAAASTLAP